MQTLSITELYEILKIGYGSFEQPDYVSVEERRHDASLRHLIDCLQTEHKYTDISDSNDDVSVILQSSGGAARHILYLSLVGRAAFLDYDAVESERLSSVVDLISAAGWRFVKRRDLSLKAPFPTYIAGESATMFNVLFADGYVTPT